MRDEEREIRLALADLAADSTSDHPPVEDLFRFHQGQLDADSAAEIRDHLSCCRECSALALSVPEFNHAEDTLAQRASPQTRHAGRGQPWLALVASLLLGIACGLFASRAGIGPRNNGAGNVGDEPSQANASNGLEVILIPLHSQVERSEETLPVGSGLVVMLLDPLEALTAGTVGVLERRISGGTEIVHRGDVALNRLGTYSFAVHAALLTPGYYHLRLVEPTGNTLPESFTIGFRGSS